MLGQGKWPCPINHQAFGIYCLSLWHRRERERESGCTHAQGTLTGNQGLREGAGVENLGAAGTWQVKELLSWLVA